jgi:hypothetical protein
VIQGYQVIQRKPTDRDKTRYTVRDLYSGQQYEVAWPYLVTEKEALESVYDVKKGDLFLMGITANNSAIYYTI